MQFISQRYSPFWRNTQSPSPLDGRAAGFVCRTRLLLFAVATLVASHVVAAQAIQSVGLSFGSFKGVPGLTDRKWGPGVVAQVELGGKRVRLMLEAGHVVIPNAASCCGPPGGFTYDDHGLLATLGPELIMGSDRLHLGLTAAIGAEEYKEVRKGAVPGFSPAPGTWHGQAIGRLGAMISRDINEKLGVTISGSEYTSLTNGVLSGFHPQPSLGLGLSWHSGRHR